jgi:hypothetical protein
MARKRADVHKLTERLYCSLVEEWLKKCALVMPLDRNVLAMCYCILHLSWGCCLDFIQADAFVFTFNITVSGEDEPHGCHATLSLSWSLIRFHL